MIQDIFPYRLDHAFRDREPEPEDCFFSFRGGEVLLRVSEDGSRRIPVFHDLGMPFVEVRRLAVFLFCVDGVTVYLLRQQGDVLPEREGMQYLPLRELDWQRHWRLVYIRRRIFFWIFTAEMTMRWPWHLSISPHARGQG